MMVRGEKKPMKEKRNDLVDEERWVKKNEGSVSVMLSVGCGDRANRIMS